MYNSDNNKTNEEKAEQAPCGGSSPIPGQTLPLAKMKIGDIGTVLSSPTKARARRKFADVGLIPGAKVEMEARAPLGSLIRISLLGTSIAISGDDAQGVNVRIIKSGENAL